MGEIIPLEMGDFLEINKTLVRGVVSLNESEASCGDALIERKVDFISFATFSWSAIRTATDDGRRTTRLKL